MKDFFVKNFGPNFSERFKGKRIYTDAAAATPIHPRVKRRLVKLLDVYGNPGALHKEAVMAKKELEGARSEIAAAIGAHADEIFFTGSGTEANNLALMGVLKPLLREAGGRKKIRAITLCIEHPSVLEPLQHLTKYGLDVADLSVNEDGLVSIKDFEEALTPDTALVSIQLVNSEVGTIEPLRDVAKIIRHARKERVAAGNTLPLYFHTDAAQAPLYLEVDVEKLGVDLMTLDAQKVLGPKSVGMVYRRRGTAMEPVLFGGGQEEGLRPGTEHAALAGAFAEALSIAQADTEKRAKKIYTVRDFLIAEIARKIPDAQINGSRIERIANNVNLSIPGLEGEMAVIAMDALGIAIATRSACAAGDEEPSRVIRALGHSRSRAREAIRITLLPDATRKDAIRIADALHKVCTLYRKS